MTKINKILSCALALTIAASAGSAVISSAEYDESPAVVQPEVNEAGAEADANGFIIEDGVLKIYTGSNAEVAIPNTVHTIGRGAFAECTSLTKITIPNSVTTIEQSAFSGCTGLTEITLPESLTDLRLGAFEGCANLKKITFNTLDFCEGSSLLNDFEGLDRSPEEPLTIILGNTVKSIPERYFGSCNVLKEITIPDSVKTIGKWAFTECINLESVTIGKGVETIGNTAFSNCICLKEITIPGNVKTVDAFAFAQCTALESVTIEEGVETIGKGAFEECSSLESVTIEEGVETIDERAFSACDKLNAMTIPKSVKTIGVLAIDAEFKDNGIVLNVKKDITYAGTKSEWLSLAEKLYLNPTFHEYNRVHCSDGDITDADVSANVKTISSIAITAPKSAPKLYTGYDFDPTGYTLKVTYSDKTTETINLTADMVSGYDKTKPGNQTLTVTYGGKTATFKVSVTELKATKLEVSKLPKTTYFLNETIDLSEGTFSVTFNNGKTEEVPMSDSRVTVKGFDSTKTGSEKVTLGLLGKTVTVNMTIAVDPENAPVIMNGAGYENLTAAIAAINADVKAKTPKDSYTINIKGETLTEAKAVKFPAVKVIITSEKPAVVTVPSITASGDLTIENISFKTVKGDAAAVTAKKSLTVTNCTLGKTAITGAANITDSILGAVTVKGELTVTATEASKTVMESLTVSAKTGTTKLNGDIKVTKNLTVSNDLVIDGNSEVGGKFTAKAALSINGFVVKNGK